LATLEDRSLDANTAPDLGSSEYYTNRELSWIDFNGRVLEEVLDERIPLLERVKFLSIFSSNLDEFFMIRVSGLRRQLEAGALEAPPDGMTPAEQLDAIRDRLMPMLEERARCWNNDLRPKLRQEGIRVLDYSELKRKQRKLLRQHFEREIFPILTPLAFDPGHPFPHISNLSVNLAVEIHDPSHGERFARLKVPNALKRLLRIPSEEKAGGLEHLDLVDHKGSYFVWLEQVVAANLDLLFPGMDIVSAYPFRVTRDADLEIEEDEASDLITTMQDIVAQRHFGSAVRLEVDSRMPERICSILSRNLRISPYQLYTVDGPMGLSDVMELTKVDRPRLKDTPFLPLTPPELTAEESVFSVLRERDVLLYHPYDSFGPVVEFIKTAAKDPDVVAIKQTLYRTGPHSPIVQALREARESGKQVSALVELKARFDEENNITWARALEEAGVHVVYGLVGLKVHCKMCLIVRRESDGIRRYVHLGTGNYNPVTARIYTDLGYFTADPEVAADVSDLFNSLTGYSKQHEYRKLLVSPHSMRDQLLERIDREIARHAANSDGYIAFKMNSLVDKRCIRKLYEASQAGVRVELQVRGICCLRPGLLGISENIRVTSLVGRFLEHSRIYYFRNGGDEEILLGSADLMPRNLAGRVELLFPVRDPDLRQALRDDILFLHLRDNVQSRVLTAEGVYERVAPAEGEELLHSQEFRLSHRGSWHPED
jgi:polyphosphate kinase